MAVLPRVDFSDAAPFKIDGVYCKLLALTKGMYSIVNANDYDWLAQYNWLYWSGGRAARKAKQSDYDAGWRPRSAIFLAHFIRGNGKPPVIPSGLTIDHRNGVALDDRRVNHRLANAQQQVFNTRSSGSRSGYKHIRIVSYKNSTYYVVYYRQNGRFFSKCCPKMDVAIAYRDKTLRELRGEFVRLD